MPTSPLLRLWNYAAGHRRHILLATSCSVLNKIFDLAQTVQHGMMS